MTTLKFSNIKSFTDLTFHIFYSTFRQSKLMPNESFSSCYAQHPVTEGCGNLNTTSDLSNSYTVLSSLVNLCEFMSFFKY